MPLDLCPVYRLRRVYASFLNLPNRDNELLFVLGCEFNESSQGKAVDS